MNDENPRLYQATLLRLGELLAARLYHGIRLVAAGVACCPTPAALRVLGGHLRELTVYLIELSEQHSALGGASLTPLPRLRLDTPDVPTAWPPFTMAWWVTTRQIRWHFHEHGACAHEPTRALATRVVATLDARTASLERFAEEAIRTSERAVLAETLDRYVAWAVEAFGRPGTPGMAYAIRMGLRRRDADAVREDFLDDLRAMCRAWSFPLADRWLPPPERASFVHALRDLAETDRSASGSVPQDPVAPSVHPTGVERDASEG